VVGAGDKVSFEVGSLVVGAGDTVGAVLFAVTFTVGSYVEGAGDTVGESVVFASVNCRAYSSPPPRRRRFFSEAVEAPKLSTRISVEASFIVLSK
jgi:hypothetical protein